MEPVVRSRLEPEVIEEGHRIADEILATISKWGEEPGDLILPQRISVTEEEYTALAQFMIDSDYMTYSDLKDGLRVCGVRVDLWFGIKVANPAGMTTET